MPPTTSSLAERIAALQRANAAQRRSPADNPTPAFTHTHTHSHTHMHTHTHTIPEPEPEPAPHELSSLGRPVSSLSTHASVSASVSPSPSPSPSPARRAVSDRTPSVANTADRASPVWPEALFSGRYSSSSNNNNNHALNHDQHQDHEHGQDHEHDHGGGLSRPASQPAAPSAPAARATPALASGPSLRERIARLQLQATSPRGAACSDTDSPAVSSLRTGPSPSSFQYRPLARRFSIDPEAKPLAPQWTGSPSLGMGRGASPWGEVPLRAQRTGSAMASYSSGPGLHPHPSSLNPGPNANLATTNALPLSLPLSRESSFSPSLSPSPSPSPAPFHHLSQTTNSASNAGNGTDKPAIQDDGPSPPLIRVPSSIGLVSSSSNTDTATGSEFSPSVVVSFEGEYEASNNETMTEGEDVTDPGDPTSAEHRQERCLAPLSSTPCNSTPGVRAGANTSPNPSTSASASASASTSTSTSTAPSQGQSSSTGIGTATGTGIVSGAGSGAGPSLDATTTAISGKDAQSSLITSQPTTTRPPSAPSVSAPSPSRPERKVSPGAAAALEAIAQGRKKGTVITPAEGHGMLKNLHARTGLRPSAAEDAPLVVLPPQRKKHLTGRVRSITQDQVPDHLLALQRLRRRREEREQRAAKEKHELRQRTLAAGPSSTLSLSGSDSTSTVAREKENEANAKEWSISPSPPASSPVPSGPVGRMGSKVPSDDPALPDAHNVAMSSVQEEETAESESTSSSAAVTCQPSTDATPAQTPWSQSQAQTLGQQKDHPSAPAQSANSSVHMEHDRPQSTTTQPVSPPHVGAPHVRAAQVDAEANRLDQLGWSERPRRMGSTGDPGNAEGTKGQVPPNADGSDSFRVGSDKALSNQPPPAGYSRAVVTAGVGPSSFARTLAPARPISKENSPEARPSSVVLDPVSPAQRVMLAQQTGSSTSTTTTPNMAQMEPYLPQHPMSEKAVSKPVGPKGEHERASNGILSSPAARTNAPTLPDQIHPDNQILNLARDPKHSSAWASRQSEEQQLSKEEPDTPHQPAQMASVQTPVGQTTGQTTETGKNSARPPRHSGRSGKLRLPPPGAVLSLADLDASDEEDKYEPGWVMKISTSRQ